MLRKSDVFGPIWRIYTFILIFMIFMSFSSENADTGFYIKYYIFLITMCALSILPFMSRTLTYLYINATQTFIFFIFLGTTLLWNFVASDFNPFYSIVSLLVSLVGGTIFVLGRIQPNLMLSIIRTVIYINIGGLIYQFFLFAITGDIPYLHGDLFPFSRDRYMLVILGGFERFTGFQMEPGGYSTMITLALIYYRSLSGRVDRTFIIGSMSVMLTFATIAMIYFAVLCLVILLEVKWKKPRNLFPVIAAFGIVVGILIYGGIIENILSRFDRGFEGDSSLNVKVINLVSYTQFSTVELLTGMGIENIDRDCIGCNYVKSNGVFFYMAYSLGILGFIIVLSLLIRSFQKGVVCLLFAIILLLCRYPLNFPVFWVIFLCLWTWEGPVKTRISRGANNWKKSDPEMRYISQPLS